MTLSTPRLIGSTTSPFVRKVRVVLIEKSIDHHFEPAAAWNPASPANRLNPLQKVPVLEWPGRGVWVDSRVIVQALEAWVPEPPVWPASVEARLAALQVEALADGVADAAALLTQETWRPEASRSPFWMDRQLQKVVGGLEALDRVDGLVAQAGAPVPGLAAIAAVAAWEFSRFWQPGPVGALHLPQLAEAGRALAARPSWAATTPVLPPGWSAPRL